MAAQTSNTSDRPGSAPSTNTVTGGGSAITIPAHTTVSTVDGTASTIVVQQTIIVTERGSSAGGISEGAKIGIILGSLLLLLLLGAGVFWWRHRHHRRVRSQLMHIHPIDPVREYNLFLCL